MCEWVWNKHIMPAFTLLRRRKQTYIPKGKTSGYENCWQKSYFATDPKLLLVGFFCMGVEVKPHCEPLFSDQYNTHSGAGYSEICCANILCSWDADWCMKRLLRSCFQHVKEKRETMKRGFQNQALKFKAKYCTKTTSWVFMCKKTIFESFSFFA